MRPAITWAAEPADVKQPPGGGEPGQTPSAAMGTGAQCKRPAERLPGAPEARVVYATDGQGNQRPGPSAPQSGTPKSKNANDQANGQLGPRSTPRTPHAKQTGKTRPAREKNAQRLEARPRFRVRAYARRAKLLL